ncbi:MAG: hypothetical protein QOF57_2037 [Frankiaceae bacterium]|jgi:hypothetical protein|nr:hypothetical protein [Frankiaceae bacterium]MDQ1726459.1 hypothetical protein [Frankiaceae bacterium]
MNPRSPASRRVGALAFGAAVPGVLLVTILLIGNHASAQPVQSDDIGPGPTASVSSTAFGGLPQTGPPIVSDFQTDSTSGYASGLSSVDLFGCQPVLTTPKAGGKPVLVNPATCKSRPKGQ